MVIKHQRFSYPFAFVIAASTPNWIYISPVGFFLRVNVGIAINFRSGGLKNAGFYPLCQTQHIQGSQHTGFDGLDRIVLVMNGRSRAGQIIDLVDLEQDRMHYVVPYDFEVGVGEKMGDIVLGTCKEVVETDDFGAGLDQAIAQMAS